MLPNGWQRRAFGEVTRIGNGQVDPKSEPYASLPHIGPENVVSNSGQIIAVKTCKELGLISGKYEFDEESVVYSKIRPNLNKACKPKFKGVCSADMYPIWVGNELNSEYLLHFMLGPEFVKLAVAMSMRTGMPKINRSDLTSLAIMLPPIAEQKKIAKILSTWDEAIVSTEQLLTISQQQKKALMHLLLSGKSRFNGFSAEWRRHQIKTLLLEGKERNKDRSVTRVLSITNHSGFVLPEDQFNKRVASDDVSNYKIVRKGQFGYNPSRINVGSFARLDEYEEGILSPMYVIFSVNQNHLNSDYFLHWMSSGEAKSRIAASTQGSVRESVGFDALCAIHIMLPPKEEQVKIATVLSIADLEIETLRQKIVCLKQEKKALMQQLLTGKKRVTIN